jgi:hypothetical protein
VLLHELERATFELLSAIAGPISDGMGGYIVDGSGNPIAGPLPAIGVGNPPTFTIYKGESNADVVLPCCIIHADEGDEDYDTGNQFVELTVDTRIHANPIPGVIDNPIAFGQAITQAIIGVMQFSSLPDELNVYAGEQLTVIGISGRTQGKMTVDNAFVHQVRVRLYCANANVR